MSATIAHGRPRHRQRRAARGASGGVSPARVRVGAVPAGRGPWRVLPGVLALLALVAGCTAGTDPGVRVQPVVRGTVSEVVQAPATVTAKATATVSAPVGGSLTLLPVQDGQHVRAGQVLFVVDSPAARQQLAQARQADARSASAAVSPLAGAVSARSSGPGAARAAGRSGAAAVGFSQLAQQARVQADQGFADAEAAARRIGDPQARAQALAAVTSARAQLATALAQAQAGVQQAQTAVAQAEAAAQAAFEQVRQGVGGLSAALASLGTAQRLQTRAAVASAQQVVDSLTVRAPIAGTVSLSAPPSGGALSGSAQALVGATGSGGAAAPGGGAGLGALSAALGGASGSNLSAPLAVGSPVSAGTALLSLVDDSQLSLAAEVDETDVLQVKAGQSADVELDAVPGGRYAARVLSIDPSATSSGRGGVGYVARLSLGRGTIADGSVADGSAADGSAAAPTPRPGMSAIASIAVRTDTSTLVLPAAALVRDGDRQVVFVVTGSGDNQVAHRRVVTLGAQGDASVSVTSGLRERERVVVRGAERVRDGAKLP